MCPFKKDCAWVKPSVVVVPEETTEQGERLRFDLGALCRASVLSPSGPAEMTRKCLEGAPRDRQHLIPLLLSTGPGFEFGL